MARFIIEGGRQLNGMVRPSGNKNEALPALMACLLTDEVVTLQRMPQIQDVLTVCDILKNLGVEMDWIGDECIQLCAKNIKHAHPDADLCSRVRASILLLGPLLARIGQITLPLPGGDVIGARRIDTHWHGVEALGAQLELSQGSIKGKIKQLTGASLFLDEPSVTATENLILMSVLAPGTTTIVNAASEPHVTGLCKLLNSMGARISGLGSNILTIQGVSRLKGTTYTIGADFMEAGSFICLGSHGGGSITVEDVDPRDFYFILKTLNRLGIHTQTGEQSITVHSGRSTAIQKDVTGRIPTIYSGPWPAFPTDLMSVAIVAATQAEGMVLFFEKMFEGRMFFTDKLMAMGAEIVLCDPHRIVVNGPCQLHCATMSSPDVRAGMALVIAALFARGKSEINNIYQIDRGYYKVEEKLKQLGAAITRVQD